MLKRVGVKEGPSVFFSLILFFILLVNHGGSLSSTTIMDKIFVANFSFYLK